MLRFLAYGSFVLVSGHVLAALLEENVQACAVQGDALGVNYSHAPRSLTTVGGAFIKRFVARKGLADLEGEGRDGGRLVVGRFGLDVTKVDLGQGAGDLRIGRAFYVLKLKPRMHRQGAHIFGTIELILV